MSKPIQTITNEQAFSRALPKWPQLKITGESVTIEQAKDIIFRTDGFITSLSEYSGGNNHSWNKWAFQRLHYDELFKMTEMAYGKTATPGFVKKYYEVVHKISDDLGFLKTHYISNDWASCSFVFGPHGWCSPSGQICYVDNVGKWPDVEEVFNDVKMIAEAFPYLKMTATLMDREQSEEGTHPVVTFVVREGQVFITDEHNEHHYEVQEPDRSDNAMMARLLSDKEQGLPNKWILEFGERTKPVIQAAVLKLRKDADDMKK